jgi:transposase
VRRAEKGAPDQALGRSRGGLTTKIHLLADSFGRPVAISLTPGQAHDLGPAEALLEGQTVRHVLADRAYRDRIERLISRLKRFRRIATGYDRRARYFLSAIYLVASLNG